MTAHITGNPAIPDSEERAARKAALFAHKLETGFWDDQGRVAPWPDDIDEWTRTTDELHTIELGLIEEVARGCGVERFGRVRHRRDVAARRVLEVEEADAATSAAGLRDEREQAVRAFAHCQLCGPYVAE